MNDNLHCHETERCVELLNEHSETLRIKYHLAKDADGSDRYPVVDMVIESIGTGFQTFRLCSREDCNKVIELLWSVRNAAFPNP